jgi:hypothetical protein
MMNQKFIIADNFYDIAHPFHKSFFDNQCLITEETTKKLSELLGNEINIIESFNEAIPENSQNLITANTFCDWICVIYLTLPSNCVSKKGLSFYKHKKTNLDSFPNEYSCKVNGWNSIEDIVDSFDVMNKNDWEEYSNIFVKYNRCVIFSADYWHSYGNGFGNELNNVLLYQKLLLKNV